MARPRGLMLIVVVGCFVGLFLACFGKALHRENQFGFRDAAHYYYPLYQKVQDEWNEGRWPLWEREENSGMPLLGNPTAAVLYPGKLIYALLPYPWAARIYIVSHAALAFAAMLVTVRCWGVSWTGSGLAALGYAFGAPILFQYCNIIYLVGAAWLPLGFLAIDRWLTRGSRLAILGLAVVLAMQTMGGDPQASYLLGLCGGAYAVGLSWRRSASDPASRSEPNDDRRRRWWLIPLLLLGAALWFGVTIALAEYFPRVRPTGNPAPALPWMRHAPRAMALLWGSAGVVFLVKWWRKPDRSPLGWMLIGLAASALLAGLISAAQLLPTLEFTQQTARAEGEGPHDIYPFSLEPYRIAELFWPKIFGTSLGINSYWFDAFRLPGVRQKIWVPSIYLGCLSPVLALAAFALRRGDPRRVWLSLVVIVSLLGSLGQYTSPIWLTRLVATTTGVSVPDIGPLDTHDATPIRLDRYLRDGDGGIYWWLTTALPGMRQFRFPAKLFTFTTFGLCALAGIGWDRLQERARTRKLAIAGFGLLGVTSLVMLGLALNYREPFIKQLTAANITSGFGPLVVETAYHGLIQSLVHGAAMALIAIIILSQAARRPQLAGALALVIAAADLGVANSGFVITVPQKLLEEEPKLVQLIREAEKAKPADGPYRVHRMPQWNPTSWFTRSSANRLEEFVQWENATIQPKYGINHGIEYTQTMGVAEIYDYEWFFGGFPYSVRGEAAQRLGVEPGGKVIYYPRRSYDMWNTRYFIVPQFPNGWNDEHRAFAGFGHESVLIYPKPGTFSGPNKTELLKEWIETSDYQLLRNEQAFPRSWIVHDAIGLPPLDGMTRARRAGPMQEMLHAGDPIWNDRSLPVHDPHKVLWIDGNDLAELRHYLNGRPPWSSETVKVSYPRPDRVELEANLESPGIVILADIYYPGWKLTIDEKPATIYRVNRLMRGAAVSEGKHTLVYEYDPASFRIGRIVSLASLGLLLILGLTFWRRPYSGSVAGMTVPAPAPTPVED